MENTAYNAHLLEQSPHKLEEFLVPEVELSHLEGTLLVALQQPPDQVASPGGGMSPGIP